MAHFIGGGDPSDEVDGGASEEGEVVDGFGDEGFTFFESSVLFGDDGIDG